MYSRLTAAMLTVLRSAPQSWERCGSDNWSTKEALERRGLVEIRREGEALMCNWIWRLTKPGRRIREIEK